MNSPQKSSNQLSEKQQFFPRQLQASVVNLDLLGKVLYLKLHMHTGETILLVLFTKLIPITARNCLSCSI